MTSVCRKCALYRDCLERRGFCSSYRPVDLEKIRREIQKLNEDQSKKSASGTGVSSAEEDRAGRSRDDTETYHETEGHPKTVTGTASQGNKRNHMDG